MKKIFFTMAFVTILCGVIGVGLQFMFGYDTITYISRERINDIWIYKYDFWKYLENLTNSLTTPNLELKLPTRTWGWGVDDLLNDLAFIVNILIMTVNVLLYPLRVGALTCRTLLSFVGINVINPTSGNPLKWLVDTINTINTLGIPYI